jgi:preprotein translocase subunit YajC
MFKVLFSSLQSFADVPAAAAAAVPPQAPVWMQFVPFVIIIGVFYFFLIRPQAKKQKEVQTFLSGLKNGDQVITQSGILGRITNLTESVATLEVANEVQMKFLRSQILTSQSVLQAKKEGK